jgi:long-subunit fatty acid transport protein
VRALVVLVGLAGVLGSAPAARASGITLGHFGGIFGTPNADGGLAVYWNPARISAQPGGFAAVDGTFEYRIASFDRVVDDPTASPDQQAVNSGRATLENVGVVPYGAVGYTFGIGSVQLGVGAGVFPAYGGAASWDKNDSAPARYPGAVDGPQRWSTIQAQLVVLNYSGALSATLPDLGLSAGFSVAYVGAELNTVRARNLNRTDDLVDAQGNILEGRVHFDGTGDAVAFTAGASYEIDNVRVAFTYHSGYSLHLVGPARQAYATSAPTTVNAFLELPLPHVFQTAVSVTLGALHLTGMTDFSAWSAMKSNDVLVESTRERLLLIPRDLDNTFSIRALVGWQFTDDLEITGMLGFDPSAVPPETADSSLYDADKIEVGLGARLQLDSLRLLASYTHDIFLPVHVTNSRQEPAQNGTYRDTRGALNLSLEARF